MLIALAVSVSVAASIFGLAHDRGDSKNWRQIKELHYAPGHNSPSQALDLYLPQPSQVVPPPIIVFIHGGGWISGDKSEVPPEVTEHPGYACASINYRLSNEAIYPAQLDDCKAAIRWLRAHANQYHYDGERIGVWGMSAGGHLAALLGTTCGDKRFEGTEGDMKVSSTVQAVCDWCGPTDLIAIVNEAGKEDKLEVHSSEGPVAKLLGGMPAEHLALAQQANPCLYARAEDPPFLIMHGDADTMVPIEQSIDLYKALQAAHVRSHLITIKDGGHNFYSPESLAIVYKFFDEELRNKR